MDVSVWKMKRAFDVVDSYKTIDISRIWHMLKVHVYLLASLHGIMSGSS